MSKLRVILFSTLFVACAPNASTKGQLITCTTDPNSGTLLSCQPGGGGGDGTCQDVDEDGDGDPHDEDVDDDDDDSTSVARTADHGSASSSDDDEDDDGVADCDDDDDDNDGIDDDDDCDEQEGEDSDEADLPYDVRMNVGDSVTPIADAFAEEGAQPLAIISVEMDGGGAGWRLAELQAGATFTVSAADCSHTGNRDVGRDRVIVTWRSANGAVESDHLDLRYCN
ncbi:MAG TPA: hypothetical protein VL326_24995 [Kofleriaceae bacterium]|jgi:hypothetical protein|nr:hypothetical protein [Kofleriaceae bacterium]